jgi:tRNA modification GTPase
MIDTERQDTICAIATPPGNGAIAIIRLSGPVSLAIADEIFQPSKKNVKISKEPGYTIHFGSIQNQGEIVDEVLLSVFKEPNSYTGENAIEISCHGSQYIQKMIIELLLEKGARHARPGEFTMRAFLNGKFDLSQAEAVADLIAASSGTSHELALNQMRGGFSFRIKELRTKLVNFISLVELELDFSQEDVEFADRDQLKELVTELYSEIEQLVSSFKVGNVLKKGIPVAIVGKPNVGKSTLLNAILNEEKAIVTDIPGTTRDVIEDTIILGSYGFRFIDTAGLRHSTDRVESIGIERTYEMIEKASVVLYVFDVGSADCSEIKKELEEFKVQGSGYKDTVAGREDNRTVGQEDEVSANQQSTSRTPHRAISNVKQFILVANKTDLLEEAPKGLKEFLDMECLFVSAKRKENINLISERLLLAVDELNIQDQTLVSNLRHYEALANTKKSLESTLEGLESGLSNDLLATDIRDALFHLGTITGEITTDEILGNIFSKFCIGK